MKIRDPLMDDLHRLVDPFKASPEAWAYIQKEILRPAKRWAKTGSKSDHARVQAALTMIADMAALPTEELQRIADQGKP